MRQGPWRDAYNKLVSQGFRRISLARWFIAAGGLALATVAAAYFATEARLIQNGPLFEALCSVHLCSDGLLAKRAADSQDPSEQLRLYRTLVKRDPASAYRWCDLGQTLLDQKRLPEAEQAFGRAQKLAPHVPAVLMRVANAQLLLKKPQAAVPYMKSVLAMVREYDGAIFSSYERIGLSVEDIIRSALPDSAAPSYLEYLIETNQDAAASLVWKRIGRRGVVGATLAASYTNYLISRGQDAAAARAWEGYWAGDERGGFKAGRALFNGSFESEPSGSLLDWTIRPVEGATTSRDTSVAARGQTSLRIAFDGTKNVEFNHATEVVWLKPGAYRLRGSIRTDELSTDQGIRLRVFDPKNPALVDASTNSVEGTGDWRTAECLFQVPPTTAHVMVLVVRRASERIENKIRGTAWIDDVRIAPLQ